MQEPFATELTDWYKRQVTVINSKLYEKTETLANIVQGISRNYQFS